MSALAFLNTKTLRRTNGFFSKAVRFSVKQPGVKIKEHDFIS